jgi:hypothetical protein
MSGGFKASVLVGFGCGRRGIELVVLVSRRGEDASVVRCAGGDTVARGVTAQRPCPEAATHIGSRWKGIGQCGPHGQVDWQGRLGQMSSGCDGFLEYIFAVKGAISFECTNDSWAS